MKANELMVGDWICITYFDKPINAKVNEIEKYSDGHYAVCGESIYACGDEDFLPIQLTEEIMKKNRFVRKQLMKRWIISGELELIEDTMGNSDLEYWFSVSDQYICPIHYVHELQHALRLCGLYELADNFVVE